MTKGVSVVRLILGGIGFVMLLGAFALFASGMPGALIGAIWLVPSGIVLVIVAFVEVSRYRSAAAELDGASPGPGGGEQAPLDARFKRTDEVFVDPSSQRTMRVFVDSGTGERRYISEN